MIGFLRGRVELLLNPHLLLDVNGVGYKVLVSNTVLSNISIGSKLTLFTYTHVREEALDLFGFLTAEDLRLFELLIGVSGVGPKTAMGIFSVGSHIEIIDAIGKANLSFFEGVPRLGRKNAQKIIIELKNKLGSSTDLDLSEEVGKDSEDVILALQSFGFTNKEAREAFKNVGKEKKTTTKEKIKLALKYLGR